MTAAVAKTAPPQSLATKTAWSAFASFVAMAVFALSNIIIARVLGPAGTGEIAYSLWLGAAMVIVAGVGIPQTISRFLAELEGNGRHEDAENIGRWLVRRGSAWLLVGAAGVVAVEWARGISRPTLTLLCAVVAVYLGQGVTAIYLAVLAGRQDFRATSRLVLRSSFIQLTGVALGSRYAGVLGALVGYVAGAILPATASIRYALGPCRRPGADMLGRMRRFSRNTWFAAAVSLVLWSRTEVYFLERYWGAREVGLSMAQLATQGPLLMGSALMPHLSALAGAQDYRRIGDIYCALTRLLGLLLFPLCFCIAAVCPILVPMLFGQSFVPAASTASVLVAFASVGAITSASAPAMYALERSRVIAQVGAVGAATGVLVFALAIKQWGVPAAAWGRSALQVGMVTVGLWYISRRMKLPVPLAGLARMAASAAVAVIPGLLASLTGGGAASLAWAIPAMGFTYAIMLRTTRAVSEPEYLLLRRGVKSLPWRLRAAAYGVLAWIASAQARPAGQQ